MAHPPVMHGHGGYRFCPNCAHELAPTEVEGKTVPGCASCGYLHFQDPKVAVGVIVANDAGEVLLMQRSHNPRMGLWSYPSGFVDAGERVEDAAIRETLEETEVTVRLDGLQGIYSATGDRVILIIYRGTIEAGTPTPGPESLAVGYFSPDHLPDLAFERDERIIQEWKQSANR